MSGLHERARHQIALLAGDDLEGEEQAEAQRSVEACPNCRCHLVRVRGCLDILDRSGKSTDELSSRSLWPAIESQLQPIAVRCNDRFNGWVPALSMAAACIALLIAGQMDRIAPTDISAHGVGQLSQAGLLHSVTNFQRRPVRFDENAEFRPALSESPDVFPQSEFPFENRELRSRKIIVVPLPSHSSATHR